jgi:F0F1-type ATP synthase delta subunit
MKVPRHILAEAIAKRTLTVSDTRELSRQIAAYLLVENRTSELESILRDIMQYRADHGVLEAEVVTAHEVQNHVLSDVVQLLQAAYPNAKEVHVSKRLDLTVIGGLRVDMANEQLDMTVASKLATFKRLTAGENIL